MLDWLTENKIPVGRVARDIFDWLRDNGEPVIDVFADAMEALIDAILAVLQEPPNTGWFRDLPRDEIVYLYPEALHPLVIIAIFVGITWALQRSWKTCLFVALGFLFILNQGYWEETTESLTLVLSACLVCMAVGVPIGIFAAHHPQVLRRAPPDPRSDADAADLCLSDPGDRVLWHRHGAGPDCDGDLRAARADPADLSGRLGHARAAP